MKNFEAGETVVIYLDADNNKIVSPPRGTKHIMLVTEHDSSIFKVEGLGRWWWFDQPSRKPQVAQFVFRETQPLPKQPKQPNQPKRKLWASFEAPPNDTWRMCRPEAMEILAVLAAAEIDELYVAMPPREDLTWPEFMKSWGVTHIPKRLIVCGNDAWSRRVTIHSWNTVTGQIAEEWAGRDCPMDQRPARGGFL